MREYVRYVIATEDIKYKEVFFPKGSVLEEDISSNAWHLDSSLQHAIERSKLKTRKAIKQDNTPNTWRIWFYAEECKFSETPWFGKVRGITPEDTELIEEYERKEQEYHEIFRLKRGVDYEKYKEYCKKIEDFINTLNLPEGLSVHCIKLSDGCIKISIQRFDVEATSLLFGLQTKENMKESYGFICHFFGRLI